jgi:hypothetical protein
MKKLFSALLALVSLLLILTACTSKPEIPSTINSSAADISQSIGQGPAEPESEQATQATPTTTPPTTQSALPKYVPESIKLSEAEDLQSSFEWPFVPEYRFVYYRIPNSFLFLVEDREAKRAWVNEYSALAPPPEMLIVSFVKAFNVPKEDFVRVIEENRQARIDMGMDLNDEMNELPNADIIYTFDNDIINYYYRRA